MKCARRDVFLMIEPVADYSPLAPVLCAHRCGRDCQFNEGHELGQIPADEILQTRLDALIYREYLDPEYTTPNPVPWAPTTATPPPRWPPASPPQSNSASRWLLEVAEQALEAHPHRSTQRVL